ncbi:MAG: aminoacyl-tRNA hydrolase [Chlorobi bacterium]|nr:MAG: Peptidyl-tRNA hydrolase ArfB [Chlorobi bacterium OLB7]MBK8910277.1 aminoacyl-tRNA hydrolase [Chlorobiota bacterium]MBX7217397.1 aminoacyl-tRNA hydrolase [Candidatus Kapabacteria bacterium]
MDDAHLHLITGETIPISALEFATSRSGGPGGQNVNKVETKVEVRFAVAEASWLRESTRQRLLEKLANRLDSLGRIRVASSTERSQLGNRYRALERLERLMNDALEIEKPRIPTRPSRASVARRIDAKQKISAKKSDRRWRPEE